MRPHRRSLLGRAVTLRSAPPKEGEHFRTRIVDSWDGIRFELGRMRETVRYAIGDPLVIDQAGWNLLAIEDESARRDPVEMIRAQFDWVRGATQYTPDPYKMEKLQSVNRMIRAARTPQKIIMAAVSPIFAARKGLDLSKMSIDDVPPLPVRIAADCDEQATLVAALCSAVGVPTRFRLGRNGDGEGYHHVWVQADPYMNGEFGWDMDPTEPEFDELGKFAMMDHYAHMDIFDDEVVQ